VAPNTEHQESDPVAELRRPAAPLTWRERFEQVADATGTSPLRLLLGSGLAVVAVIAAMWMTRAPSPPVEVGLPFASTTAPAAATTATTGPAVVVVHVTGAVMQPGVVELPAGARVDDAITAAGGLARSADPSRLNLAALLADGERVYVLAVGEVMAPVVAGPDGGGPAGSGGAGTASPESPVDLNTADEAGLDALPGVGPATAAAIVEHRNRIGGFTSVDQLLDVRGIGEAKLESLRDLVTV
jgi:competence protein ComEA